MIRATRADPPGHAGSEPERRATYGAALQQFDELLSASAVAGHASRPLPLFYALNQAGRALAAHELFKTLDAKEAIETLAFASLLMRRLDDALP